MRIVNKRWKACSAAAVFLLAGMTAIAQDKISKTFQVEPEAG